METRYTPGPAVNVTLSEFPTGAPSTAIWAPVASLNAWRSKSLSGFVQVAVTVILWTAGLVLVTVMRKLSHVELVQSADTGSLVDSVNGPPLHDSVVAPVVGSIGPPDGVAAFRIGGSAMNVTREKRNTRSSAGTGWTRFGVHIGDLRRKKASARLPRPPRRPVERCVDAMRCCDAPPISGNLKMVPVFVLQRGRSGGAGHLEPRLKVVATQCPSRQCVHRGSRVLFRSLEPESIPLEKDARYGERDALVPVNERVVLGQAVRVDRRQPKGASLLIREMVPGCLHCSVEQALVEDSSLAAVLSQEDVMNCQRGLFGHPSRLRRHFARSRRAFR